MENKNYSYKSYMNDKTDNSTDLWNDKSVVEEVVPDIRELHAKQRMPNESGINSFYCNSTECLLEKDKIMSMAVDGYKGYDARVKDILRNYVYLVSSQEKQIVDLEKQIKEAKANAEALVLAIHNKENLTVKWFNKNSPGINTGDRLSVIDNVTGCFIETYYA